MYMFYAEIQLFEDMIYTPWQASQMKNAETWNAHPFRFNQDLTGGEVPTSMQEIADQCF